MKALKNCDLNSAFVVFFLVMGLLVIPACKGCRGDKEDQVPVADSTADSTTDAVKVSPQRRKARTRIKVEERPPRRRVKTPQEPKDTEGDEATRSAVEPPGDQQAIKERQAKRRDLRERAKQAAEARETRQKREPEVNESPNVKPDIVRVQALQIGNFVQTTELVQALNQANGMVEAPLLGQDITADYNHMRLVPVGQESGLGFVVQVWRDASVPGARQRHEEFVKSYPGAKSNQSVTRKTFFAQYGSRSYVGFLATGQRTNVVLTCSSAICTPEQLHKVAVSIKTRLVQQ